MMRRFFWISLVLALTVVLAACGGNDPGPGPEALDQPTRPDGTYEITITDQGASPTDLVIADGDTVVMVNEGTEPRTVTINFIGIPLVEDEMIEPGAEFERAFDEPGEYECMIDDSEEPAAVINVIEPEPAE